MIRRIHILGYKSLRDVEVHLQPLTVLIGPNAAGKSNFLDALQLLSRIPGARTLKDAFEPPYRGAPLESFSFGPKGAKGLLDRDAVTFSMEVDVQLSDDVVETVNQLIRDMRRTRPTDGEGRQAPDKRSYVKERYLRYRIDVEILPKKGFLRVKDEYLAALRPDGTVAQRRKPFLSRVKDRLHLRMEGQAHPTYHDRYLDHSILSLPLYPPHYPHIAAMREELRRWFFFYFEPRERMRSPNPVKEVRHIGLMGEELASFLNTLRAMEPRQYEAVEKALRMIVPSVTGIDVDVNDLGQAELRLLEGEMPVPARLVSEGTLRILGLLSLSGAREQPSLLGFEEPENGIHPRRIRHVAEFLRNLARKDETQLVATSHSTVLADLIPSDSLYVCAKSGSSTYIKPLDAWGDLARQREIAKAMDGVDGRVSDLMLRGDLDA